MEKKFMEQINVMEKFTIRKNYARKKITGDKTTKKWMPIQFDVKIDFETFECNHKHESKISLSSMKTYSWRWISTQITKRKKSVAIVNQWNAYKI